MLRKKPRSFLLWCMHLEIRRKKNTKQLWIVDEIVLSRSYLSLPRFFRCQFVYCKRHFNISWLLLLCVDFVYVIHCVHCAMKLWSVHEIWTFLFRPNVTGARWHCLKVEFTFSASVCARKLSYMVQLDMPPKWRFPEMNDTWKGRTKNS